MRRARAGAARRTVRSAVAVVAAAGALAGGCGGGGGGDGAAANGKHGARTLQVDTASDASSGPVDLKDATCRFDGDRQFVAAGVVRNVGDKPSSYVNVSVRFVDAAGVRVDIASDSVSDLQRGESARWDASVYVDDRADEVVRCIVSTTSS